MIKDSCCHRGCKGQLLSQGLLMIKDSCCHMGY